MNKILLSLVLLFATMIAGENDTYVFEAKGQFAKDLKALVEKYSKDGKVEVKVYKKSDSIMSSVLGESRSIQSGQALYQKRCASCHGQNGERGAGAGSKILKNMSAEEIETAMDNYKRDEHFGGSMKMLMQDVAQSMRSVDLKAIIGYIKGTTSTSSNKTQNKIEDSSEEKSSYLQ